MAVFKENLKAEKTPDKAVLMSIRPEWVARILSGDKTIEVRKRIPKMAPPFKVYIYHTLPPLTEWNEMAGKVVGEFTCDEVYRYARIGTTGSSRTYYKRVDSDYMTHDIDYSPMCLSPQQFADYGSGKEVFGLHVSGLKIYEQPKKLNEFYLYYPCSGCKQKDSYHCLFHCNGKRAVRQGPQSWHYVEAK